ncbi:hypothetical protein Q8A73_009476 [Channa argus]|nr:hypothetical protein Q8A73_009476 [Channa argus]
MHLQGDARSRKGQDIECVRSLFALRENRLEPLGRDMNNNDSQWYSDVDGNLHMIRSVGLMRSQEPLLSEDLTSPRSSLEGSRPVGQVDKHILLLVHGVGNAGKSWGNSITDDDFKSARA